MAIVSSCAAEEEMVGSSARMVALLLMTQVMACASEHSDSGDQHDRAGAAAGEQSAGAGGSASGGECQWPSELAPLGTQMRDVCVATRAYLSCKAAGAGVECASADAVTCVDESEFKVISCTNRCAADEYAAICGGVGPGNVPDPPDGCRLVLANPGGSVAYCCPCQ